MEIGELKITGSIDTLNIEKGINGIVLDMQKVDQKSQSVNSDFERMNSSANKLATSLGLIGGSAALINMAKNSPQVAGDMASIQMSMLSLGFAVGQALKPAFDWFAGALNGLASWANENPNLFGGIVNGIVILGTTLTGATIMKGFASLVEWLGISVPAAVGIFTTSLGGVLGVLGVLATIGVIIVAAAGLWQVLSQMSKDAVAFENYGNLQTAGGGNKEVGYDQYTNGQFNSLSGTRSYVSNPNNSAIINNQQAVQDYDADSSLTYANNAIQLQYKQTAAMRLPNLSTGYSL